MQEETRGKSNRGSNFIIVALLIVILFMARGSFTVPTIVQPVAPVPVAPTAVPVPTAVVMPTASSPTYAGGTIVYTNKVTPVVFPNGVIDDFAPCIALVVSHSNGEYTSVTWFDEQVYVLSTDISESWGSCNIFPPAP